jgi:hypothetical protein
MERVGRVAGVEDDLAHRKRPPPGARQQLLRVLGRDPIQE